MGQVVCAIADEKTQILFIVLAKTTNCILRTDVSAKSDLCPTIPAHIYFLSVFLLNFIIVNMYLESKQYVVTT